MKKCHILWKLEYSNTIVWILRSHEDVAFCYEEFQYKNVNIQKPRKDNTLCYKEIQCVNVTINLPLLEWESVIFGASLKIPIQQCEYQEAMNML